MMTTSDARQEGLLVDMGWSTLREQGHQQRFGFGVGDHGAWFLGGNGGNCPLHVAHKELSGHKLQTVVVQCALLEGSLDNITVAVRAIRLRCAGRRGS
jgi:hypothetical protein